MFMRLILLFMHTCSTYYLIESSKAHSVQSNKYEPLLLLLARSIIYYYLLGARRLELDSARNATRVGYS